MIFNLKDEVSFLKSITERNCFSVNLGKQEIISVAVDSETEFTSWMETLLHNKTELDQAKLMGQREQKNIKGEVDRFNQLWGGGEAASDSGVLSGVHNRGASIDSTNPMVGSGSVIVGPSNDPSLHPPELSSYMTKRGGHMKTWRKRWFVLEAFTLTYYKKKDDKKPKARVVINAECTVLPVCENKKVRKKHPNAFCLITNGRTYFFDCDDNQLKSDWLFNIRRTISMAKDLLTNQLETIAGRSTSTGTVEIPGGVHPSPQAQTLPPSAEGSTQQLAEQEKAVLITPPQSMPSVPPLQHATPLSSAGGGGDSIGPGRGSDSVGSDVGAGDRTDDQGPASLVLTGSTPELQVSNVLSKPVVWNRFNETNETLKTTQVEFTLFATNLRPSPAARRKSMQATESQQGHSSGKTTRPIASSHLRIKQSKQMKTKRFPTNCDLSQFEYQRIGKHPFRTNTVEKLPVAVYARACVVDVPKSGDRALEISLHVEDSRCRVGPETPWGVAMFTVSQLLGAPEGILHLPVEITGQKNSNFEAGAHPTIHVRLSKVPYDPISPSICELWGMQSQTYVFRTPQLERAEVICAREECHETIASFQIPLLYLKFRVAEWISNFAALKARCEKLLRAFIESDEALAKEMQENQHVIDQSKSRKSRSVSAVEVSQAKKRLTTLKKEHAKMQTTEQRSAWMFEHLSEHNRIVSHYTHAIDLLKPLFKSIPSNAYKNKCISLTFKKSSDKKKSAVRMLPTNLHLCLWRVWKAEKLPLTENDSEAYIADMASAVSTPKQANKRSSFLTGKRQSFLHSAVVKTGPVQGVSGREDAEDDEEGDDDDGGLKHDFHMTFTADGEGANDTIYDTVTFGAPAAHVFGFKKGGLLAMQKKRKKLLDGEHDLDDDEEDDHLATVQWFYKDEEGVEQGPWNTENMRDWYSERFLNDDLPCRLATDPSNHWPTLGERFRDEPSAFPEGYGEYALEEARAARAAAGLDGKDESKGKDEMKREAESMALAIEHRKDLTVCQALSALVLSFSTRLEIVGARSQEFLQQLEHVGYLFQVESLVSTHGDEQGMLDDFIVAMDALQGFAFRLSQLGDNTDTETWQKREKLTQIRGQMAALGHASENYKRFEEAAVMLEEQIRSEMEVLEEQWYYCDDENEVQGPFPASHMRSWYPDYLDDNVRVQRLGEAHDQWGSIGERFAHCGPFPSPTLAAVRAGVGLKEISMERNEDNNCVITLKVPTHIWVKLPAMLQSGNLIYVHPILVQQGINEFQSIANRTGKLARLQNEVNTAALNKYKKYMQKVTEHSHEIGMSASDIEIAQKLMKDFAFAVQKESPSRKNIDILHAAQRVTRCLRGGRGTCCKSAKDRTSMSLTLEQAQLLYHNESPTHIEKEDKAMLRLDPADRCTLWSANMMREYGVRIMNAKKNVGKKKVSLVRCHSQPLWCFPPFVLVYLSSLTINTNHTYTRNTSTMF
jgi:hypothetical protein